MRSTLARTCLLRLMLSLFAISPMQTFSLNSSPSPTAMISLQGAGSEKRREKSQHAWTLTLDPKAGSIQFDAIGRPSALKIHGKGSPAKGVFRIEGKSKTKVKSEGGSKSEPESNVVTVILVSGTASFDLSSLETGITLRNSHMKNKYLEVGKFPEAKFTLNPLLLPSSIQQELLSLDTLSFPLSFEGSLSLHGVEKPIQGSLKINRSHSKVTFFANFEIKISDFAIEKPGFAGITMAEDVKITVEAEGLLHAEE